MNIIQTIVSGSLGRFRRSKEHAALRARLEAEARRRHEADISGAPFWRRAWLEVVIEREVRAELRRLLPPGALYASRSSDGGA
jgi:hypothetical protein